MALQELLAKSAARESRPRPRPRPGINAREWRRSDRAAVAASSQGVAIVDVDGFRWGGGGGDQRVLGGGGVCFPPRRAPEEGRVVAQVAVLPPIIAPEGAVVGSSRRIAAPKSQRHTSSDPRASRRRRRRQRQRRSEQSFPSGYRRRCHCAGALPLLSTSSSIRPQGRRWDRFRRLPRPSKSGGSIWRLLAAQDAGVAQQRQKGGKPSVSSRTKTSGTTTESTTKY